MDNLSLNQYRLNLDEQKQAFDNQKFSASPAGKQVVQREEDMKEPVTLQSGP